MSGSGTFQGTTYQAGILAYVFVHIIVRRPLPWNWFTHVPTAALGETGGDGDDVRVEFGEDAREAELQAKHGLNKARLTEFLGAVDRESTEPVFLAADHATSTKWIFTVLGPDLERLRSGRRDDLKTQTVDLLAAFPEAVLARVHVLSLDVQNAADRECRSAEDLLHGALVDPTKAETAWRVLAYEAHRVCANRTRHNRQTLVQLLKTHDLLLRPTTEEECLDAELDRVLDQIRNFESAPALRRADELRRNALRSRNTAAASRASVLRGYALLQLDRYDDAEASAREALEHDPDRVSAHVLAARTGFMKGDQTRAVQQIDRAIALDQNDADAWGVRAIIYKGTIPPPEPPMVVVESDRYRSLLCDAYLAGQRLPELLLLTSDLLKSCVRTPSVLHARAAALADERNAEGRTDARIDADRLLSELLDGDLAEYHPMRGRALALRASVRRTLGRHADAEEDQKRSLEVGADDPHVVEVAVRQELRCGRFECALEHLQNRVCSKYPSLLFLRSQLLARSGDRADAMRDFHSAIELSVQNPSLHVGPNGVWAAIALDRFADAEAILMRGHGMTDAERSEAAGLFALGQGRLADAEKEFEGAIQKSPDQRVRLLTLLAVLLRGDHPADAARVFRSVGIDLLDADDRGLAAHAFIRSGDFEAAQQVLDLLPKDEPMPDWALGTTAEIAQHQGELERMIPVLEQLSRRGGRSERDARLGLAQLYASLEQRDRAMPHLDWLLQQADRSIAERIRLGRILAMVERFADAVSELFIAVRIAPDNPEANRTFVEVFRHGHPHARVVDEVALDTHVSLISEDGRRLEITLLSCGDVDGHSTLNRNHPTTQRLVGSSVGQTVELGSGPWEAQVWRVARIVSAEAKLFEQIVETFPHRFPAEGFLARAFQFDESALDAFLPFHRSLFARRRQRQNIDEVYRRTRPPLGQWATEIGEPIEVTMLRFLEGASGAAGLCVEWPDLARQASAVQVAAAAKRIVITRSALATAQRFGFLDDLPQVFTMMAPPSLGRALSSEVQMARRSERDEAKYLGLSDDQVRFQMQELDPGVRRSNTQRLEALLGFVRQNVQRSPRPLRAPEALPAEFLGLRPIIGEESYDAVELGIEARVPLYADDLGLRHLNDFIPGGSSFSSIGLLTALEDRETDKRIRVRQRLELARSGYQFIRGSRSIILEAMRGSTYQHEPLATALGVLSPPQMELREAAAVVVDVAIAMEQHDISIILTRSQFLQRAFEALSNTWPPSAIAASTIAAAEQACVPFRPRELDMIRREARDHLRKAVDRAPVRGRP